MNPLRGLLELIRDIPVRDLPLATRPTVWWPRELLSAFVAEAAMFAPRETGNAVVGYEAEGAIVVCGLVPGGPRARRRRGSFVPDGRWQEEAIASIYGSSGRIQTYLGEIHSHPGGGCALSFRDRRTARAIARHRAARAPLPLMAVAARASADWDFGVWRLVAGGLDPCVIRIVREAELPAVAPQSHI